MNNLQLEHLNNCKITIKPPLYKELDKQKMKKWKKRSMILIRLQKLHGKLFSGDVDVYVCVFICALKTLPSPVRLYYGVAETPSCSSVQLRDTSCIHRHRPLLAFDVCSAAQP